MRRPHLLKDNKSSQSYSHLIFFDTETNNISSTLMSTTVEFRLGVACYVRKKSNTYYESWFQTTSREKLCDWIYSHSRRKTCLYIIASNIWFDIRVTGLIQYLHRRGFRVKQVYVEGNRVIIKMIDKFGRSIRFLNIQNFFPSSVEELGKMIGKEKLSVDFANVSDEELFVYCRRDVEIIKDSFLHLDRFRRKNDLGSMGYTISSMAFNVFRHCFMHHRIYIHDNYDVLHLERRGYFGGRNECFYLGRFSRRRYYLLDVNSLYPYVMRENYYPTRLVQVVKSPSVNVIECYGKNYWLMAECRIATNEPVFPYRYRGKTIFPVGEFDTVLYDYGLRYALNKGFVKEIKTLVLYNSEKIFVKYVDWFYRRRLEFKNQNNNVFQNLCKLLMNSLYGKFGQRADCVISSKNCATCEFSVEKIYDVDTKQYLVRYRLADYEIILKRQCEESINSFPAIAGAVTEYGRFVLWDYMLMAGLKNVYYVDTDSLIVNDDGYNRLKRYINPTLLGYLKLENETDYLELRGCKDYIFGSTEKIKGVRRNALKIDDNTYMQIYFPTYKSDNVTNNNTYTIRYVIKNLRRNYDKGKVLSNGKVRPYYIYNDIIVE